jgi:hypothetical protein
MSLMAQEGIALSRSSPISIHEEESCVRAAWIESAGQIPDQIDAMIMDARFLDAAIELALTTLEPGLPAGWLMSFTSAGAPYEVKLFRDRDDGSPVLGKSEQALSLAFLDAISKWQ